MPHQDDNSDRPKTLPLPELDPTLNPVLGQNMGRWAEVYFTSAPEKRQEAVLELLRTLEAENGAGAEAQVAPPLVVDRTPVPQVSLKSQIAEDPPRLIVCDSCGRENRAHQRFCGMCGARLEKEAEADRREEPPQATAALPQSWERIPPLEHVFEESPLTPHEFSPARDGVEQGSSENRLGHLFAEPPGSNSHLYYIGAALTIVILAISYIAWRGAHATSGRSQLAPQAPAELSRQPATPAPIPVAPNGAPSVSDPTAAAAQPASKAAGTNPPSAEEATPATTPQSAEEKNPQPVAISGGGSEELATALRYLNGTDGQQRNTTEAVNWLWKAVAKRNAEATLLLSDIFLKGNGVPQNCDQGRVLLDAAASRGSKDAAERLRHLQAFGCQ